LEPEYCSRYSDQAGQSRVRIPVEARDFSLLQNAQTGSGVHPASCSVGTGVKTYMRFLSESLKQLAYGMEMNVEKTKVMKISRQPSPMEIMIDQKKWRMWNISIIG
jgi:hypothetical protein